MSNQDQLNLADAAREQFRLTRVQTYNWGTFAGMGDFVIPRQGYLFVGPSGSGKSTVLDGHAALLTPPKWLKFNVAARENTRAAPDRNLLTYVRGAWSTQTNASGSITAQYLRPGTTWSAIVETYRNEAGRIVTLAMVLWVRGASTAPADLKRLYLTAEREIELQTLDFFPQHDFDVRRFKNDLPDVSVHHEFSAYSERFRRLLGIDNDRALRLLHKTQSAKDLGDLNSFLREFMLDEPATFEDADRLVAEFDELNAAHKSVVAARDQVDVLGPAKTKGELFEAHSIQRNAIKDVQTGLEHYIERRRREMLDAQIEQFGLSQDALHQRVTTAAAAAENEFSRLSELRQRRLGMGGGALERLQREFDAANRELPLRKKYRDQVQVACDTLGWSQPQNVTEFVQLVEQARQLTQAADDESRRIEEEKDELKADLRKVQEQVTTLHRELEAMRRQPSNIPANLLSIRSAIAKGVGLAEQDLPFAGELIQVKEDCAEWRGAVERVLRGFAQSLLVDEQYFDRVAAFVNGQHLGGRVVYQRMTAHSTSSSPSARSLVRKLDIAPGHDHAGWLRDELKSRFDYECVDSPAELRSARRAVTREGQVKHSVSSFEKDDRFKVNDARNWVLGFDNQAKREMYEAEGQAAVMRMEALKRRLDELNDQERGQRDKLKRSVELSNRTWDEIDVEQLLVHIKDLETRIAKEREGNADLKALDADISAQERAHSAATDELVNLKAELKQTEDRIASLRARRAQSEREVTVMAETDEQRQSLDERFAKLGQEITWENIDARSKSISRSLSEELATLERQMQELRHAITTAFAEFNRRWPAEAGGLDASMASAPDYFAKLERLQGDRLPEFEARFFQLLSDQSTQNLSVLRHNLVDERVRIRSRMEQVNEALSGCNFNPGTYLSIETVDRSLPDVTDFLASLRDALSHSTSADRAIMEQRFKVLQSLVKRLSSQESVDVRWRETVLDVRQHVEFVARERDADGMEIEVYKSGAGKSGGQRQKLTATCLGAALRYQLGGDDRGMPSFCTVVMDEAFDKADSEFTAMVMTIFREFGFQMVVATPMKSVMTLEPFIGGACVVEIKDRKRSAALFIDYDTENQRLNLPQSLRHVEEAPLS